ncbi:fatty acyl-CoA reductase 1-like [Culicoides brevitarsis]|uniref:fatty acyl-CoA reductase 1-like n=1 Tax=Culicoides brevitarsis TaxID=469753 RepID=UPI00307C942B
MLRFLFAPKLHLSNASKKFNVGQEHQLTFVTQKSGTGFVGKTIIEKLLRSCPDVKRIIILLRGKKGKSIEERIADYKQQVIFSLIQKSDPSSLDKIIGIEGDLSSGTWSVPDDAKLKSELESVNVIFHCAASVRFDDSLQKAILINVCGTKAILDFAKTLKKLDVFMHVSTAYSNCDRLKIEEKIYPAHVDWRTTIKIAKLIDEDTLNALFAKYSSNMANTYVFAKHVAECMVNDYKDELPLIIFRPSIVTSAEVEPLPGYIDSFNGPMGLMVATAIGINRTSWQSHEAAINATPVDLCVKGIVIAASKRPKPGDEIKIYNAASIKTTKYVDAVKQGKRYCVTKAPPNMFFWRPGGRLTENYYEFYLRLVFTQLIPAAIADVMLHLMNKKTFFLKLQRALINAQTSLHYFMNNVWDIKNDNFLQLSHDVPPEEYNDFNLKEVYPDYIDYGSLCMLGARRFLLNWPDKDLEKGKRNLQIAIWIDKIVKYTFFFVIFWILYTKYVK